jgi:hypothetical protein
MKASVIIASLLASLSRASSAFTNLIANYEIGDAGIPLDPRILVPDPSVITDLELALYYLRYRCSIAATSPSPAPSVDGEAELFARITFPKPVKIKDGVPVDPRAEEGPVNIEEIASFMVCQHAYLRTLGENVEYTPSATSLISSLLPGYELALSSSDCSESGHEQLSRGGSKTEFDDRLSLSWSYYCDDIKERMPCASVDLTNCETFFVGRQHVRLFTDYFSDDKVKTEPRKPSTTPQQQRKSGIQHRPINTPTKRASRADTRRHSPLGTSCSWERDSAFARMPFGQSVC